MKVLRKFRRPRWLAAIACLAVAAPAIFVVSGVSTAGKSAVASQAAPVIDRDYVYGQLFDMTYSVVYRVSGADGDPRVVQAGGADAFNEPATINGWQEFFLHWKAQLKDSSPKGMGSLAKFATVSDHFFRRAPQAYVVPSGAPNFYSFDPNFKWDSDDAEVTIPGASCAGQRVLIAASADGTAVSPGIVGDVNNSQQSTSPVFGFGAARRTQTLSNLGNGGAYDDTSGVVLGMGEYQALLGWYQANHTFPAKTLKVALLDANAGKGADGTYTREGSAYYVNNLIPQGPQGQYAMFAMMDQNGISYPALHLGSLRYWNDLTSGADGPWRTFVTDTPTAPNQQYPDTGPGSAGANISANSAASAQFDADLKSAVTAGFAQQSAKYGGTVPAENPLRMDRSGGSAPLPAVATPLVPAYSASDQATYSPVHPAGTGDEALIKSTEDAAASFWNAGVAGFSVGGDIDSNLSENPYPSSVDASIRATPVLGYTGAHTSFALASNVPAAGMSTTTAATAVGATTVPVATGANFTPGQPFFIDTGSNLETGYITAVSGNTITLNAPLTMAHASGARFHVNEAQPVGMTGDTLERLNYWASGAPHGVGGETKPTEELLRALELPAQYTAMLISGGNYLGATSMPSGTLAYFENSPNNPSAGQSVSFNGSFSRAKEGGTAGLKYYWDFGDGSTSTAMSPTHTYASAGWYDAKLVVVKGQKSKWGTYRQAIKVGSPSGAAPSTPACGTFSAAEKSALLDAAQKAVKKPGALAREKD